MTRADAEDDAEGGEQGAGLLGAQIGDGLAEVGEEDHLERAFMAPFCCGFAGLELLVGIGHGDDFAFLDAGDDGLAFAAADEGDVVGDEAVGAAGVDEGAAVALEEGLGGNPEDVVEGLDGDDHVGGHAGAQFGGGLIERDAGFEVAIPGRAGGAADDS